MFVLLIVDWGLLQNGTYNKKLFKRGEIVQIILVMFGELVWIERNAQLDLYRVAFGMRPEYPQLVSPQKAMLQLRDHFGSKLAEVV